MKINLSMKNENYCSGKLTPNLIRFNSWIQILVYVIEKQRLSRKQICHEKCELPFKKLNLDFIGPKVRKLSLHNQKEIIVLDTENDNEIKNFSSNLKNLLEPD